MQCYLTVNQQTTIADYLSIVTDRQLKETLTKFTQGKQSLAIKGRHRKTCLPAGQRLCCCCTLSEPETELHTLSPNVKSTNKRAGLNKLGAVLLSATN